MHRPMPFPVLIVLLLLLATGAAGCSGPMTGSTGPGGGPATPAASPPAFPEGSTVSPAAPFPDPEPYEISPRFVKNIAEYGEGGRPLVTIYDATSTLSYQSEALLADVVKAPLLITFTVTPGHTNPNYCYFILTIRDADTSTVVGQEGYARAFSSESTKKLAFTTPGRYHLTLHGAMVDVRLRLQAGG